MNRQEMLAEVAQIVKQREEDYNSPGGSLQAIADYWEVHLRHRQPGPMTGVDVAQMMILFKQARLDKNPKHEDSWKDTAGYAACGIEIATMKEVTNKQDKVLEFMHNTHDSNGRWPALVDIANHFKFKSATGARKHMLNMEKKGLVKNVNRVWVPV